MGISMNSIRLPVELLDNNKPIQPLKYNNNFLCLNTYYAYYVGVRGNEPEWQLSWSKTCWRPVNEHYRDLSFYPYCTWRIVE
jgi:hypothetical protein